MKLSDNELKSIVQHEVAQAVAYSDEWQSQDREEALRYYMGEPYGDEIEGRSQVVSRDVSDTIEWILPALMRIFASGDKVVEFLPNGPEDEKTAEQATDYANYIIEKNNSFLLQYTWQKDALLQRVGVVKVWWEKETEVKVDERVGLTSDEFTVYISSIPENAKIIAHSVDDMELPDGNVVQLHSVKAKWENVEGCVKIEGVPPEEFIISARAKSLDDATFVGHRKIVARSELIEQGYDEDIVNSLPTYSANDYSGEKLARFQGDASTNDSLDPVMQLVSVCECYIKVDYDGDGAAEWRKILIGGDDASGEILDNEEWPLDYVPFASLSPILMPHTFWGRSVSDLVMDIQRIKSVILRQMLDGLYLSNQPRTEIVDGQVNLDDLLTHRPGGVVRVKAPGMMREIQTAWVGAQAFPMIQYIDAVRQERSGASPQGMGPDANALQNVSATAFAGQTDMAKQRVELIARIFAEVGYKRLFRLILKFITQYQDKETVIRLRNEWVPIDPRGWSADMDVKINVGLGTGNKDSQLGHLMAVAAKQEAILQIAGPDNPLVGMGEYHNTLKAMITNAGLGDPSLYFKDPGAVAGIQGQQQKPPQPDPKMIEAQAKAQMEQVKLQINAQAQQEKLQADIALGNARLQAEIALKREQMAAEMALKREQMMMEAQLKASGLTAGAGVGDVRMGGQIG